MFLKHVYKTQKTKHVTLWWLTFIHNLIFVRHIYYGTFCTPFLIISIGWLGVLVHCFEFNCICIVIQNSKSNNKQIKRSQNILNKNLIHFIDCSICVFLSSFIVIINITFCFNIFLEFPKKNNFNLLFFFIIEITSNNVKKEEIVIILITVI